ncbi:Arm DNA-binding domain-containing protein [Phocaeicola sp.]|uniref:Arm DNA-binding domain-containing protein n=1 Tax=Phocaeicola sp. TaxID=2773926 RepID=UPI003AB4B25B
MVRSSFAILFFIRESRVRKDGTASIEVVLTVNGERCTLSTGKQVPIDKWDK